MAKNCIIAFNDSKLIDYCLQNCVIGIFVLLQKCLLVHKYIENIKN